MKLNVGMEMDKLLKSSVVFLFTCLLARGEEFFVGESHEGWWFTTIRYESADTRPVWFGGSLKCENAFPSDTPGNQSQEFGVSVVLHFDDGTEAWEPFARWNPGTHDWQTAQNVYYPRKPVTSATLRVRANPGPGSAQYRDVFVRREDPGLEIVRWLRITDRPFSDRDFLFVAFPRPYSWKSEAAGGLTASGQNTNRALVPIPPGAGRVTLRLSCNGRNAERTISYEASHLAESPVAQGEARVWTADSMRAVTPLTFPDEAAAKELKILLAQRGIASGQILVTSGKGTAFTNVTLEAEVPRTAAGVVFDGSVAWQRVGYVRRHPDATIHPLAPDREIRWFPDPLFPAAPMTVRPGSTQGAWVTFTARPETAAGLYRGVVKVKAGERVLAHVPVTLGVLPFAQPERFGCPAIHALFESHVLNLYKERGREMLERAWEMMLDHRLNPDGCGNRWYEPIPVETLKKWCARGMSRTSVIALNVRAASPATMWVSDPTREQTEDPAFYDDIRNRLMPYVEELRANGLIDRVYAYGFDERQDDQFKAIAAFWRRFKKDFPDVPMMTTAFMYRRRAEGKKVEDWTATDWHCPGMPYWRKALTDELHAQGKQAWWYICCGPCYPRLNVGIEHPPLEGRLLTWQQYRENCDGVFNWGVNYWHRRSLVDDSDVYLSGWNYGAGMSGMTGDGLMIYPGKNGPIPSIRLANVRDGVQDYEWMKLAESKVGGEAVQAVVGTIAPDQTHIVRDPARIHAARAKLVQLIQKGRQ